MDLIGSLIGSCMVSLYYKWYIFSRSKIVCDIEGNGWDYMYARARRVLPVKVYQETC